MKNKFLNNQDYYHTIKSIAEEKREAAQNAIYNRLERWANDEWIDDTKAFSKYWSVFVKSIYKMILTK